MTLSPRRPLLVVVGALGLGAVIFVLVWFQPQKLFIDDKVDEALPEASPPAAESPDRGTSDTVSPTATPDAVDLRTGSFVSRDHTTTGSVRLLELPDGKRYLRLENLATDNGPDLFVYLSTNPADGPEGAFDDRFTNLGRLKGNVGNQNYELPTDLSIEEFASVVIWCDRFDAAFGAADLAPA